MGGRHTFRQVRVQGLRLFTVTPANQLFFRQHSGVWAAVLQQNQFNRLIPGFPWPGEITARITTGRQQQKTAGE